MSKFYEVQELTNAGWVNTWAGPDNWAYYTSIEEAQSDIEYHVENCAYSYKIGLIPDVPSLSSFRIVEVSDSIALKGL
jgi:hypothetical protein